MNLGWHFVGDKLRDGSPIPADGEWLEHSGELVMCSTGLHYSRHLLDALTYAPGSVVCRVEVRGGHYEDDKGVARARRIVWRLDAEDILRRFARLCALDVIRLWDAPEVVIRYLQTGDESIRDAAWTATRDAAWAATRDARGARDAVRAAAWDATATRDAAWTATRAARGARDAARAAAWAAARDATRDAAWTAARARQNRRLTSLVAHARRGCP